MNRCVLAANPIPAKHDQLLQLGILMAQRSQLAPLGQAQTANCFFQRWNVLLANAQAATDLGHFLAVDPGATRAR